MIPWFEIENALKELKANEGWLIFQRVAVSIIQRMDRTFIACERRGDLGLDAHAPASISPGGVGKGMAASLTADLGKISGDAIKTKKNYDDIGVLIFVTTEYVTKKQQKPWIKKIKERFGYQLIVMSREDIVVRLRDPANLDLCRILGISTPTEKDVVDLANNAQVAASKFIDGRFSSAPLTGKPLLLLRSMKVDGEGCETG